MKWNPVLHPRGGAGRFRTVSKRHVVSNKPLAVKQNGVPITLVDTFPMPEPEPEPEPQPSRIGAWLREVLGLD